MKKASKTNRPLSAESIAQLADRGKDISGYFTNTGKIMPPLESVGVDLNQQTIAELNKAAKKLKISRQALIELFIRSGLEQHYLGQKNRKAV